MDSGKSRNLETTVKRVCRDLLVPKINTSKKMTTLTNSPNGLEVPSDIKKSCGEKQTEITAERVKLPKSIKEKQNNELEKVALKRKAEGEEKLPGKKEAKITELDNQPVTTVPLPHIPLKNIMDVEMKLVYVDEEDVSYEFAQPYMWAGLQATGQSATMMPPASARDLATLPQIDKWLQVALKDASSCYRQKKYAVAAGQFRTALELCSKGAALGKPFEAHAEDIASVASFIETKLVTCYLRMRKPDLALNHAHRSIVLNPAYFRNHLRQAAVFRCLERYSEAARSAMIADYMFWLCGGSEHCVSKLIKLYWQMSLLRRTSQWTLASRQRAPELLLQGLAVRRPRALTAGGGPLWKLWEKLLTPTQACVESLTCGGSSAVKQQRLRPCQLHGSSICAENTKTSHPIQAVLGIEIILISTLLMACRAS